MIDFWILYCYQYISGSLRRICKYDETSRWWANAKKGQFYLEYNDVKIFVANWASIKVHCKSKHIFSICEFWCLSTEHNYLLYTISLRLISYQKMLRNISFELGFCYYHISISREIKVWEGLTQPFHSNDYKTSA